MIKLNEEQVMIKEITNKFINQIMDQFIDKMEEEEKYSKELLLEAGNIGLCGMRIPEQYGGLGLGYTELSMVLSALAEKYPAFATSLIPSSFAAEILLAFGSEVQKSKYLSDIAAGKKLCSFAVTESSGGSNWFLTNESTAKKEENKYILNGSKSMISNAGDADIYIVLVRTDCNLGPMGFSAFIIEKEFKGFSIGTIEHKIGLQGYAIGELIFNNCEVPEENLLGKEGDGLNIFQCGGNLQCVGIGSVALGISRSAYKATLDFVKNKSFDGQKTISLLENVQVAMAEMFKNLESSELLMDKAVELLDDKTFTMYPVSACMNSIENVLEITNKAVELHGGCGITKDYSVSKKLLDAKTLSVQMTYDQMLALMGKSILGL